MEKQNFNIFYKDPIHFNANPLNQEIYGIEELNEDFKEDIRDNGVREPIVVNKQGYIISGHRRWRAAILAGLHEIPVRIEEYPDAKSEEMALISYNNQRIKSKAQVVEEVKRLRKIFKEMGIQRRLKNLKQFSNDNHSENTENVHTFDENDEGMQYLGHLKKMAVSPGRSNDKIANITGTSPTTVSRIGTVIDAAENEDPQISEPAKERLEQIKNGEMGFKPASELTRKDIKAKREGRKPEGQRGRPKGATSGPISTTGVKTLMQTKLEDFKAESKGVEVLREWLIEQAEEKTLEAKAYALKRGDKKVRESDFRRALNKPAY